MTRLSLRCCCLFVALSPGLAQAQPAPGSASAMQQGAKAVSPAPQQPVQRIQAVAPNGGPPARTAVRPATDIQPIVQPQAVPPIPQPPEWAVRMPESEAKWIDDVLHYWEARSDKVKLFECKFQRWDYEGGFVDAEGNRQPRMFAEGSIKYAQPDKGLYHVEKLVAVMPPAKPADKPQYVVQNPELGEHWICDGEKVYSFEANKKQVTVTPLPSEMRGKAIADGPLPFMFGAKAETIKARYWIRRLVADPNDKSKQNKYWLEAVPKSRIDAQNFKSVQIVLDEEQYLPESIVIFSPNYDPPRNDARQTYVFSGRKAQDNASIQKAIAEKLDPLGVFHRDFFNPKIPLGWKKVEQPDIVGIPAAPPQQARPPQPQRQY
jgi:TIGR03009 family protein